MKHSVGRGASGRPRTLTALLTGALAAAALTAVSGATPANAAITSPAPDSVIRDAGPVTIAESRGGQYATIAAATTSDNFFARGCNGGNVNRPKANGRITVTRISDGVEVVNVFHQTSNNLFSLSTANATGPFSAVWDTTDAQPGLYRVKSVVNDRAKVGAASSQTCTADTNTVLSNFTVEYRPWQHSNFNDLLGHGKVRMNTTPREFQFTVDGTGSSVISATPDEMQFYSGALPALPADPSVCATDPSACIPADATACDPASGCTPRLVYINRQGADNLTGIFDLETGAFAAIAATGGKTRVLASAGTDIDAILSDLIAQSAAGAGATGLDLLALLNTTVEIRSLFNETGEIQTVEVGALRGLQISRAAAAPDAVNGISLKAPYTVNAGFITHSVSPMIYAQADGPPSVFTVKKSPLVPNLPTLFSVPLGGLGSMELLAPVPVPAPVSSITGPLLLVGGGPLVNIRGTYPDGKGKHVAGTGGTGGPNVDTAPNAPSGLPAWLPGIDGRSVADKGPIDFLGHAALFLDLPTICFVGTCLDTGSLLIGQGVTVFGDSPLPALGTLPLLWDTENPAAAELNELTSNLALELLTNPAVGQVLTGALSLLGGGTPDVNAVVATLSDAGTLADLVDTVSGVAGLDAVPGLEDNLNEVGVVTEMVPETGGGEPNPLAWLTALFGG